ncbi:MAG: GNAT family N-acetyltransferase [Cypionkella sp.]
MVSPEIVVDDLSGDGPYAVVVEADRGALLYHSLKYGRFLKQLMPAARCEYLVALEGSRPVAALPTFALDHPVHGAVVNSLPFYGSHGGILSSPEASREALAGLYRAFHERNRAGGAIAATVVGNPLGSASVPPEPAPDLTDRRIGQFSPLPPRGEPEEVADRLFGQYHQKTRNMVRKGLKAGYVMRDDGSPAMFAALARMHEEGMRAIGGKFKGPGFFAAVQSAFDEGSDFRLFVAETSAGAIAAMVLVLYYRNYAEYFVPVSDADHRSNQPLSALIHHAMVESVIHNGSDCWNWGGTWLSQDGVYRFKSRWGTIDKEYEYHIWLYPENGDVTRLTRRELGAAYPDFFAVPYSALASEQMEAHDG